MCIHSVYFWLRDDLSDQQLADFKGGLKQLGAIDTVRASFLGTPAGTDRAVVDNDYDYAWIVHFDNKADHEHYQQVDVHLAFGELCGCFWSDLKIYDCEL